MPGNIAAATPSGVLPQTLSLAFRETRELPMLSTQYHDGTTERSIITDTVNAPTSLRTWRIQKRLPAANAIALRAFYEGQNGGQVPFYFYNPFEPAMGQPFGSNYDATGVSTQGRHTCVFRMQAWVGSTGIPFTEAAIEMAEID